MPIYDTAFGLELVHIKVCVILFKSNAHVWSELETVSYHVSVAVVVIYTL